MDLVGAAEISATGQTHFSVEKAKPFKAIRLKLKGKKRK